MLTHRERVTKAIHFERPDRLPHYLPDGEDNDVLWVAPWTGAEAGEKLPLDKQSWTVIGSIEQRIDCWGVTWERGLGQKDNMGQAKKYAIEDITKQGEYVFPDLNNPKYYHVRKKMVAENDASDNPKYALGVMGIPSLNEGTHNIRGLHNMFMDYYENPDHLKALVARFAENQRQSIRLLAGLGCDGVMGYDDWGLQDRLMLSPDLIEEFFLPHYRQNWSLAHELGMDVWLHSCGYIIELLPKLIDAGLNVIQMDQQENMGLENLSKKVGSKIAFWSPVDIQNTMIKGSIQDIESYVQDMIRTLGGHNGGLVSMAYSTPEAVGHDAAKTAAMCRAFRKYGIYYDEE
jgi:uroporphyrinogen decarboxylase